MNSRERVLAALRGEEPDRVPNVEASLPEKIARALMPDCKDVPDFLDRMDMDMMACRAAYRETPPAADGSFQDEWGVTYRPAVETLAHPVHGPIRTMADVRAYQPPDPNSPYRLGKLPELVARYKGKRAIRFTHRAAFMWSAYLMDMDKLLLNMMLEPEMVCALMDKVLETNLIVARNAIRAGADIILLGDDYAGNLGPLMSPALFGEFIQPRLKRMVDVIHEEGALCIKHTDGNIYSILDMLVAAGIDCINPIEPQAGMDLKTVKERVGDKIALCGNIDCGRLLSRGTIEEVRQAVREAIAIAAPGGGYLLCSSNSVTSSSNPKAFLAMIEACREYGTYPLSPEVLRAGA